MGRSVVFTCVAALVVFAVVQDRVVVAGVAEYVSAYRDADLTRLRHATARSAPPRDAGSRPRVTIDEVMNPAVRASVQHGALWGGVVLVVGLGGTFVARRRRRA